MRVYICQEHPAKTYTSWRKFRGHWSTQHRGEECPPREEFMQEVEREAVLEVKREKREDKKERAEAKEYGPREGAPGEFTLPEESVPRLSRILEVHGVPDEITTSILGIFQLHPAYRENPVNLHYLLTAKLPRKLHASIPMMISAFTTQDQGYPEGAGIGMIPGMPGAGPMPPFMYGGGYSPPYPPSYGFQPFYRQPMGGHEAEEEDGKRRRVKESNPVQDAVALLGTILDLKDKLMPESGGGSAQVQEIFEGFRSTIEELSKDSKEQQEELLKRLEKSEESHKESLEGIKASLNQSEKDRLQDRINQLEESKDDERSSGLGELIREAGEGLGTQAEGIRQSLDGGLKKVGDIVEKVVSTGLSSEATIIRRSKEGAPVRKKSVADAARLMEAEEAVEILVKQVTASKSQE